MIGARDDRVDDIGTTGLLYCQRLSQRRGLVVEEGIDDVISSFDRIDRVQHSRTKA